MTNRKEGDMDVEKGILRECAEAIKEQNNNGNEEVWIVEDEETETVKCAACGEIYEQPVEDEDTIDLESCPNCGEHDPLWMGICPGCQCEGWGYSQLCEDCKEEFGHLFMFSSPEEKAQGWVSMNLCQDCGCRTEMWQCKQRIWREVVPPQPNDRPDWLLGGYYCRGCFEKRLGRRIAREEIILEEDF